LCALYLCIIAKYQHVFWAKKTGAIQDGAGMSDFSSEGESEKTAIECGGNDFFLLTANYDLDSK
jgi:hypothetical protein